MSTYIKQLASVEFHANTKLANASIESLRKEAEKCGTEIENLKAAAEKGVKTAVFDGMEMDIEKAIGKFQKLQKTFLTDAKNLTKGVNAFTELWKNWRQGTIESMTAQQIKAGMNGSLQIDKRLRLDDKEDQAKRRVTENMRQQGQIVLDKMKIDTENVIRTLEDGGNVAEETLKNEKKYLQEMLSLSEKFSPEWNDYNRQLTKINELYEKQIAAERRLRGEIVDANDARREAAKLDKEEAEAAADEHARQQTIINDATEEIKKQQDLRREHEANMQAAEKEIASLNNQLREQKQVVDSVKEENRQRKKSKKDREQLVKTAEEEARKAQETAETLRKAAETEASGVDAFRTKVTKAEQKVKDLQAKLVEFNKTAIKPEVDTEGIRDLEAQLKSSKAVLNDLIAAQESGNEKLKRFGITANEVADDAKLQAAAERALKIEEESRLELQKKLIANRKQMGANLLASNDSRLVGTKEDQDFYQQHKDVLNNEYWKKQAGGGSISKLYGYLNKPWNKDVLAEFEKQVGMSVDDALRVAAQRMREVIQQSLKRGFKIDDAMVAYNEYYGKGPAIELRDYLHEFNRQVDKQELDIISKRAGDLRSIKDVVVNPWDKEESKEVRLQKAKENLKSLGMRWGKEPLSEQISQKQAEIEPLTEQLAKLKKVEEEANAIEEKRKKITDEIASAENERKAAVDALAAKQEEVNKKQGEYNTAAETAKQKQEALNNARADGSQRLTDETKKYDELDKKKKETIATYNQEKEAVDKANTAIREQSRIVSDAQQIQAQNRQLTVQSINRIIALLTEYDKSIDTNSEEWATNEKTIGRLNVRLEEMRQRSAELQNEPLMKSMQETLDKAQGGGFATASMDELSQAIKRLKDYQALIKDPNGAGQQTFLAAQEQVAELTNRLNELKGVTEKVGAGFANADEVIKRFHEHLAEPKVEQAAQQTEQVTNTLDESLKKQMSDVDDEIKRATDRLKDYESQLKEAQDELASLEAERAKHQKKMDNRSALGKRLHGKSDQERLQELNLDIEGGVDSTGFEWTGQKKRVETRQGTVDLAKENLAYWEQEKAAILERNEALHQSTQAEEQQAQAQAKTQESRRLTREEMQEGIKILEEEAFMQDRTTKEGQQRYAELRQTIDEMNQELKVASGEWMSLHDAETLASKVGTDGFFATTEQVKQATDALNRQRDALIKTIQQKQADGIATSHEEEQLRTLEQELKDLKFEQDNFNMSHKRMTDLLAQPKSATDLEELRAAIKRADGELKRLKNSLGENSKAYTELAEQTKNAKNVMKEMEGQAKASASAWEKAWSRLKTYVGMYMGFNIMWGKLEGTVGDLMTLSDKMGEVRKTTGLTADQVGRLSDKLSKLDVRTPIQELMELASTAGTLGLKSEEDIYGFTEAANKMMIALPEMGQDAAMQLMRVAMATGEVDRIRKQLQEGTIEGSSATAVAMEKIASTIDRLRASSAATAPEITDFVKRVGAVGAQSGISVDQVAALGSTVSSLGMGVEMAGTALSRMIPAIKNNAFSIAQILGVTPDSIRELFEAGRGIEVILQIFQKMHDQNMDADSIEKLLGTGGMQEIMKELNQQGARAGIVFAGLSQNVDQLRASLGVAKEAYEENTAIQQEFDRMNETTAAKWERLKNQVEEVFVNDQTNTFMGNVVDLLRTIIDLLTGSGGLSAAIRGILLTIGILKINIGASIGSLIEGGKAAKDTIQDIGEAFNVVDKETKKIQWGNVLFAAASAIFSIVMAIRSAAEEATKFNQELAKLDEDEATAERDVNNLTSAFTESSAKVEEAENKQAALEAQTKKLREEINILKGSTDQSAASTAQLNAKQTELKKKEEALKKATDESNKANGERSKLINEINSKYSKYLNYMLSEKATAEQVAAAHWQIVDALKAENAEKHLKKAQEKIDSETEEDINNAGGNSRNALNQLPADVTNRIVSQWNTLRGAVRYSIGGNGKGTYTIPVIEGINNKELSAGSLKELQGAMRSIFYGIIDRNTSYIGKDHKKHYINLGVHAVTRPHDLYDTAPAAGVANTVKDVVNQSFLPFYNWMEETMKREERMEQARRETEDYTHGINATAISDANRANNLAYGEITSALKNVSTNKTLTGSQITKFAQNVSIIEGNLSNFHGDLSNTDRYIGRGQEANIENIVNKIFGGRLNTQQRQQIIAAANKTQSSIDTASGSNGAYMPPAYTPIPTNPWGTSPSAASTNWSKMNAKELVARRKQMNEFVKALQEDTDVEAVLAEDPALQNAIKKGMSKDMRTVVSWYNTQRLKIQDELHSRFLTNTGNWQDPKNKHAQKKAQKMVKDEMAYYLDELDAYYTERKSRIEEAQGDGEISEAEAQRRILQNEQQWYLRRGELQQLYGKNREKVTTSEAQAIYEILDNRTGEGIGFIMEQILSTIGFIEKVGKEKSVQAMRRIYGDIDKGTEQSFMKSQTAVAKQMQAIAAIIEKERPFDGITKNLRDNLTTMGLLQTDFEKRRNELLKAATVDQEKLDKLQDEETKELPRRLTFLLQEAENAYSMTWEKFEKDMRSKGFGSWADAISTPDQKEAMIAQLHTVYDAVQEAIKKESSLVKKIVENQWNDAILPGNVSMKETYEKAMTALGVEEGRVSRANNLIGAGAMSSTVADKLAIKQMEVQLNMLTHYYNLMKQIGQERVANLQRLEAEARKQGDINKAEQLALDAKHAQTSLDLSTTEEETALAKQREEIIARTEESQNRLYTSLREWAELFTSSIQSVFEASNTGLGDYYNNLAKMRLTGEGSEGGTYVIIDNAGTKDAEAHYETLDGEDALKRQLEIEQQNATADAWKKVMDDINQKMSDTITDWMNSQLQDQAIDANTLALEQNTKALYDSMNSGSSENRGTEWDGKTRNKEGMAVDSDGNVIYPIQPENTESMPRAQRKRMGLSVDENPYDYTEDSTSDATGSEGGVLDFLSVPEETIEDGLSRWQAAYESMSEYSNMYTNQALSNQNKIKQGETATDTTMTKSSKNMFAAMISAANLYGAAYSAVTNDNLSSSQKFQMIAIQAAGQTAMTMLTAKMFETEGKVMMSLPEILAKCLGISPLAGAAIFAGLSALLGAAMGLAVSKLNKSKSQVAQVTGASASAGRLSTGMLTYAEGNVNEFTDPSTLTPGRSYNVDAADGRTYHAKYTGNNPTTHITNGPEFHLVGERGREAIIDAHTTRLLQMDDTGIWQSIQTLYNGGGLRAVRSRRGRGVRAFADGNIDDFDSVAAEAGETDVTVGGMSIDMVASLQASLDRNSEVMERAVRNGIKGVFDIHGKGGLVDSYDRGKKEANRYGTKY